MALESGCTTCMETEKANIMDINVKLEPDDSSYYGPQSGQANDEMMDNVDIKVEPNDESSENCVVNVEVDEMDKCLLCVQDSDCGSSVEMVKSEACNELAEEDDSSYYGPQLGQANDEMMDDVDIKVEPNGESSENCSVNVEVDEMDKCLLCVQDSNCGSAVKMVKSEACNELAEEDYHFCSCQTSTDKFNDYTYKKDKGYITCTEEIVEFKGSTYKVIKCNECNKRYLGMLISKQLDELDFYICELCESQKDGAKGILNRVMESGVRNLESDFCFHGNKEVLYKSQDTFAYRCKECDFTCCTEKKLKSHLRTHKFLETFRCKLCKYACSRRGDIKKHMRTHSGEKFYKCELCQYASTRLGGLKEHLRTHSAEKPYKCELCQFACTTPSDFKRHMWIHSGEKPYKCKLCHFTCTRPGSLKRHGMIHSGEKPYKCKLCQYACTTPSNLKVHVRIHSGEKPYNCELCQYVCTTAGQLKRHARIHSGEKPYKCELCEYASTQKGTLKSHMKTHSRKKP